MIEIAFRGYEKRYGLVLPKTLRKAYRRIMVQTMSREMTRFIQSRFGKLRISEADEHYPKYLERLGEISSENL